MDENTLQPKATPQLSGPARAIERSRWLSLPSWLLRFVCLPLLPAAVAVLIRYWIGDSVTMKLVNPAEVSFCLALLALLVLQGVYRLNDKDLRATLSTMLIMIIVIFLVMFALSLFAMIADESHLRSTATSLEAELAMTTPDLAAMKSLLAETKNNNEGMLNRIRWSSLILAGCTIVFAAFCKIQYKLED